MSRNSKRFLFLITHYLPVIYGAELFAKKLAEYLVRQGHQVDLVTGRWSQEWSDQESIHGVQVHRVPVVKLRYVQTISFILPQWLKAKALLTSHKYDYIHAHIFPSLVTGALLNTQAKRVLTIQGGDLADYPEIYGPAARLIKQPINWSLRQYDTVHCVSQDLSKQVEAMAGVEARIVPNGVDTKLLSLKFSGKHLLKTYRWPQAQFVLYSPSRLTEKNNLEATIKAVTRLRNQGRDIALVIAGEGHLKNHLKSVIDQAQANSYIRLLGAVEHTQSLQLAKYANGVIRVSTQEGFGISLLEAMSVGTPVIASQAGGLADFIHQRNAWVPKDTSIDGIVCTIIDLMEDTEKSTKTKRAQALVKSQYTWESILPEYLTQIYQL